MPGSSSTVRTFRSFEVFITLTVLYLLMSLFFKLVPAETADPAVSVVENVMKEAFVSVFGKPMGIVLFQLLDATQFTIYLTLIAFIGGGIVAVVIAFLRIAPRRYLVAAASGYIWLFQSVPLLMLLFLLGLGIPRLLGVNVDPWTAAAIALTVFTSAYLADVWRGALQAVPSGQWEGGYALGLSFARNLYLVVLPQASAHRGRPHDRIPRADHQGHVARLHHRVPGRHEHGKALGQRAGRRHRAVHRFPADGAHLLLPVLPAFTLVDLVGGPVGERPSSTFPTEKEQSQCSCGIRCWQCWRRRGLMLAGRDGEGGSVRRALQPVRSR